MSTRSTTLPRRLAAAAAVALSAAALLPAASAHAAPTGPVVPPPSDTITVTQPVGDGTTATLTIVLDKLEGPADTEGANGSAATQAEIAKLTKLIVPAAGDAAGLTAEERALLEADVVSPEAPAEAATGAGKGPAQVAPDGKEIGPGVIDPGRPGGSRAVLKCRDNRSWTDPRGTFYARHNCPYNNINWGYKISPAVQAIITTSVNEQGLRWWKNGHSQPANSHHVVVKSYLFHGTIGKVASWDAIDYQDYMTFGVQVGGRPGRGTLAFAGGLVPVRG
ncbi:hypothetical protein [Kitasatospora terrestris]|uniref:Uncharacterized protein n=1 Tax=Kitasatospora terrestris TaxID=258051 RepID=A0ABP9ECW4_9ACTN